MSTLVVNAIENDSGEARFNPTAATPQATTSGTEFDFTGIPSWVTRITVLFGAVSLSGTDNYLVQLGTAGGVVTSGYESTSTNPAGTDVTSTSGVVVQSGSSANAELVGEVVLTQADTDDWAAVHTVSRVDAGPDTHFGAGRIAALGATLTQVRVTRTGTDTFDAGSVNIIYE